METLEIDLQKDQELDKLSSYLHKRKLHLGKDKLELVIRSEAEVSQTVHAALVMLIWNYFFTIQSKKKEQAGNVEIFQKTLSDYFTTYNIQKLELNLQKHLGILLHWETRTSQPEVFGIWKNEKRSLDDIREKAWQRIK
jgi:hypothetical protein